jgi:peptide/nickel transport system permease protein
MSLAAAWILIAIFAPLVAPYDPLSQSAQLFAEPSSSHVFGTDELGRDVFSRVLWGSRLSLPLAFFLVAAAVGIGGVLGGIAGYFGGWVDEVVMRATDLVFAFPTIILAMAVTAALGPSLRNAVLAVVIVFWPSYARVVRGLVMSLGQAD